MKHRPVSWVGWVSDYCAGGSGFEPQMSQNRTCGHYPQMMLKIRNQVTHRLSLSIVVKWSLYNNSSWRLHAIISASISQASIKFPESKIIYSTLLPRADIPLNTLSKINRKLINSSSKPPNVHLVSHEDIFSIGTDVLHHIKHLKKRYVGLFAVNLKTAIRGRSKPSHPDPTDRPSTSFTRPFHTSPVVKNNQSIRRLYISHATYFL